MEVAARLRPGDDPDDVEAATKFALRSVARRHEVLSEEIVELGIQLERLVAEAAPGLVSLPAVGTHYAATLLVVAGDNPERLKSEASFASLCGASPVEASSGTVVRHQLNRDANHALHLICVMRMRVDERTRRYAAKRASEGKSKREIIRCLKRYAALEVYRKLKLTSELPSPPLLDIYKCLFIGLAREERERERVPRLGRRQCPPRRRRRRPCIPHE